MPVGKEKWIVHVIWLLTSKTPERQLWGFLFPFLVVGLSPQAHYWLHITVQPFDDVMANYTTHNSDNKRSEKIHVIHLLPVASIPYGVLNLYIRWNKFGFNLDLIQKGCGYPNRNKAWKGVPAQVPSAGQFYPLRITNASFTFTGTPFQVLFRVYQMP